MDLRIPFALIAITVLSVTGGCGKPQIDGATQSQDGSPSLLGNGEMTSRCPRGYLGSPYKIPLQLWSCPMSVQTLELSKPLDNLIFQVDCKKKLMGVQTEDRRIDTLWEIMPDGTFDFTIDGLSANFQDDGAGDRGCSTPASAEFRGKVDCPTDERLIDQATIHVETVWYLGHAASPSPSPAPSSSPHPSPSVTVTPTPQPSPTATAHPLPHPSPTSIFPFPFHPPVSLERSAIRLAPASATAQACKLPASCYLYSSNRILQCQ